MSDVIARVMTSCTIDGVRSAIGSLLLYLSCMILLVKKTKGLYFDRILKDGLPNQNFFFNNRKLAGIKLRIILHSLREKFFFHEVNF